MIDTPLLSSSPCLNHDILQLYLARVPWFWLRGSVSGRRQKMCCYALPLPTRPWWAGCTALLNLWTLKEYGCEREGGEGEK